MGSEHAPPRFKEEGFHCPHCGVYAHQHWYDVTLEGGSGDGTSPGETLSLCTCERCNRFSLWIDGEIIYPPTAAIPLPMEVMPAGIKEDYLEARRIADASPRAASAILRGALQKLISHLGEMEDTRANLENLANRGLDAKFQAALASVRMVGDDAVEPGKIDSRDDSETTMALFNLINLIVDALIAQPRRVDEILDKLPR